MKFKTISICEAETFFAGKSAKFRHATNDCWRNSGKNDRITETKRAGISFAGVCMVHSQKAKLLQAKGGIA